MKKIGLVVVCILLILFVAIINKQEMSKFDEKMNLLLDTYHQSEEIKNAEDKIVIMSICDGKSKAIVRSQRANSINSALEEVEKHLRSYIEENNYDAKWVKIDIVKETEKMSEKQLKNYLSNIYTFQNGIIFQNKEEEVILTRQEINTNDLTNPKIKKVNDYLKNCDDSEGLENVKVFKTTSFFCDEKNHVYELHDEGASAGRRKMENLSKDELDRIRENATNYLSDMMQNDGKFIYGYHPLTDKEIGSYNILRHNGSLWSLIVCYDGTAEKKEEIDKGLEYLNRQIIKKDENLYYVIEEKNGELKLGGAALAIIAMCEYTDKFQDTKYVDTLAKLGNGILSMQNSDGSYTHVLDSEDYSVKDKYRTVYYDGEATFALCKLYKITNDKKYLEAAQNAMRYFIEENYTEYCDHWISYAVNEITNYIDNEEYYQFGLRNVAENMEVISQKEITSHINFEMLVQCYELYQKILEKGIEIEYLKNFPEKEFEELIHTRADFQLNSYLYPEIAMYLENPSKYKDTFFIRQSKFRIRIDDIQHSILGYYNYTKNFYK